MANALYSLAREKFLGGDLDWDAASVKVSLVDATDYVINLTTHEFWSSVTVAGRVAVSSALTTKTKTFGTADADDVTLTSVTGDQCELIILFSDTGGADTTDPLIGAIDTATGLPVTPNSGDVQIQWDSGANRIFTL